MQNGSAENKDQKDQNEQSKPPRILAKVVTWAPISTLITIGGFLFYLVYNLTRSVSTNASSVLSSVHEHLVEAQARTDEQQAMTRPVVAVTNSPIASDVSEPESRASKPSSTLGQLSQEEAVQPSREQLQKELAIRAGVLRKGLASLATLSSSAMPKSQHSPITGEHSDVRRVQRVSSTGEVQEIGDNLRIIMQCPDSSFKQPIARTYESKVVGGGGGESDDAEITAVNPRRRKLHPDDEDILPPTLKIARVDTSSSEFCASTPGTTLSRDGSVIWVQSPSSGWRRRVETSVHTATNSKITPTRPRSIPV